MLMQAETSKTLGLLNLIIIYDLMYIISTDILLPHITHREPLQVKISSSRDLADFGSMEVLPSLTRF